MDFLGNKFKDAEGKEVGPEAFAGYKVIVTLYSANWWGACKPFKAKLKDFYNKVNEGGAKNVQVIQYYGDKTEDQWKASFDGMPWIALQFGETFEGVKAKIPLKHWPLPGVINGETGAVIVENAFNKIDFADPAGQLANWLAWVFWLIKEASKHRELDYFTEWGQMKSFQLMMFVRLNPKGGLSN